MIPKTKALLIAGTGSGVGKTTVAMGLMAALGKNYKVQLSRPDLISSIRVTTHESAGALPGILTACKPTL